MEVCWWEKSLTKENSKEKTSLGENGPSKWCKAKKKMNLKTFNSTCRSSWKVNSRVPGPNPLTGVDAANSKKWRKSSNLNSCISGKGRILFSEVLQHSQSQIYHCKISSIYI